MLLASPILNTSKALESCDTFNFNLETLRKTNDSFVLIYMHSRQIASTSEIWELSSLAHKLININDLLAAELNGCRQNIGKHKHEVDDFLEHSFGLKLHIKY